MDEIAVSVQGFYMIEKIELAVANFLYQPKRPSINANKLMAWRFEG